MEFDSILYEASGKLIELRRCIRGFGASSLLDDGATVVDDMSRFVLAFKDWVEKPLIGPVLELNVVFDRESRFFLGAATFEKEKEEADKIARAAARKEFIIIIIIIIIMLLYHCLLYTSPSPQD